jgi:hypothetical protein
MERYILNTILPHLNHWGYLLSFITAVGTCTSANVTTPHTISATVELN